MTALPFDVADTVNWPAVACPPTLRGTDPDVLRAEIVGIVARGIDNHPRSQQVEIGPSEYGHPCARALAYKLAGTDPTGTEKPPWRQAVGTAVHAEFSGWLAEANLDPTAPPTQAARVLHAMGVRAKDVGTRWFPDLKVTVGTYGGRVLKGHLDLYDAATATIVDLKVPGSSQMKAHRSGPRITHDEYRAQVMGYARGAKAAGFPVDRVALLRLPASGELHDHTWQCEPYDEQVVVDALQRLAGIQGLVDAVGAQAPAAFPTTEHFCGRCPWFSPGATDLTKGCPGDPAARVNQPDPLHALIAPPSTRGDAGQHNTATQETEHAR